MTLNDVFEYTWKNHWSQARYQRSGWAREVSNIFERNLKLLADKKLKTIQRKQIQELHSSLSATPFAANRALEVLSKLFNVACEEGWADGNPCQFIKAFPEVSRARYASPGEVQKLGDALEKWRPKNPEMICFFLAILYTGARPRSLERAKWSYMIEIEGGFGVLNFDGKSGDEQVIFPPEVMAQMKALPQHPEGLIFGVKMNHYLWNKIRKEAGCGDLWARDFRRTFASVGFSSGINKGEIGVLLNHKNPKTTDIYAKLDTSARIKAVRKIADKMNELLGKKMA